MNNDLGAAFAALFFYHVLSFSIILHISFLFRRYYCQTTGFGRAKKMIFLKAFLVGGLLCAVGQILIDTTKLTPARILVAFVVIGVALGALGVYKPLVEWAGCGATVPLTGFGYLLAKGTREAVVKDGLLGALTGPLSAGAAGISAAMLMGLLVSLFAKPKEK